MKTIWRYIFMRDGAIADVIMDALHYQIECDKTDIWLWKFQRRNPNV